MGKIRIHGRICYLLILVALSLGLLQGISMAKADDSDFVIDENGVLTQYIGAGGDVVVPYWVKEIGEDAFFNCKNLQSVTIPEGVTRIGNYAFCDCESMQSVSIPQSMTYVGNGAFSRCYGLMITLEEEPTYEMGSNVFEGVTVKTTRYVKEKLGIDDGAFLDIDEAEWKLSYEVISERDKTCKITGVLCAVDKTLVIPSEIDGYAVTEIGEYAFAGDVRIRSIEITENLVSIGSWAFITCKGLRNITIPGNVKNIESGAFWNCSNLESVIISEGVTTIGDSAFSSTRLKSITIPGSVKHCNECWSWCEELTTIFLSEGVLSVEGWSCGGVLEAVYIPKSLRQINIESFSNHADGSCDEHVMPKFFIDQLNPVYSSIDNGNGVVEKSTNTLIYGNENITIPEGVKIIGENALRRAHRLSEVVIPNSVTEIRSSAFSGIDELASVVIPGGVKSIGDEAFADCRSLEQVFIQDGVTSIGNGAFAWCPYLSRVVIPASVTYIGEGANSSFPGYNFALPIDGVTFYVEKDSYADHVLLERGAQVEYWNPIRLAGSSVNLSDVIDLNFFYDIGENDLEEKRYFAEILYPDGRLIKQSFDATQYQEYSGKKYYAIKCTLAAKEIGDDVAVRIIDSILDIPCGEEQKYSVKKYCEDLLQRQGENCAEAKLVKSILAYGTYSQLYFNYNTSDLALDIQQCALSDAASVREELAKTAVYEESGVLPDGIEYYGCSLVLNSSIEYRIYFKTRVPALAAQYNLVKNPDKKDLYYWEDVTVSITQLGEKEVCQIDSAIIGSNPLFFVQKVLNGSYDEKLTNLTIAIYDYYTAAMDYVYYINHKSEGNETEVI